MTLTKKIIEQLNKEYNDGAIVEVDGLGTALFNEMKKYSTREKVVTILMDMAGKGINLLSGISNVEDVRYKLYDDGNSKALVIYFKKPYEIRLYDLASGDGRQEGRLAHYRGVVLRSPDSQEAIFVKITDSSIQLANRWMKGAVNPNSKGYHPHRTKTGACFGSIITDMGSMLVESFRGTMTLLLDRLASLNWNSPYDRDAFKTVGMVYLGTDRWIKQTLGLKGVFQNVLGDFDIALASGDVDKWKEFSAKEGHSYNPDCYCYYCTCIKLIPFEKSNIVLDGASMVILERKKLKKYLCTEDLEVILRLSDKYVNSTADKKFPINTDEVSRTLDRLLQHHLTEVVNSLCEKHKKKLDIYDTANVKVLALEKEMKKVGNKRMTYQIKLKALRTTRKTYDDTDTVDMLFENPQQEEPTDEEKEEAEKQKKAKEKAYKDKIDKTYDEQEKIKVKIDGLFDGLGRFSRTTLKSLSQYRKMNLSSNDVYRNLNRLVRNEGKRIGHNWGYVFDNDYRLSKLKLSANTESDYENMNIFFREDGRNIKKITPKKKYTLTDKDYSDIVDINEEVPDDLPEIYQKQNALFDMDKIRKVMSTIIGCGTLGSNFTYLMSKVGYRIFTLIDFDIVEKHNLPNQFFDKDYCGSKKAYSLARSIYKNVPSQINGLLVPFDLKSWEFFSFKNQVKETLWKNTDVYFLVTDNLKSRYDSLMRIKDLSKKYEINPLIIDCRMNDLKHFTIYSYMLNDTEKLEAHLTTMINQEGKLIELPQEAVCGMQSSIVVATQAGLEVIDILNKYINEEELPYLTTNEVI